MAQVSLKVRYTSTSDPAQEKWMLMSTQKCVKKNIHGNFIYSSHKVEITTEQNCKIIIPIENSQTENVHTMLWNFMKKMQTNP